MEESRECSDNILKNIIKNKFNINHIKKLRKIRNIFVDGDLY